MTDRDTENTLYWLLRLFIAVNREGWEEGPSEAEVQNNVRDFLANAGLDPYTHEDAARRFLAVVEQRKGQFSFSTDMGGWADVLSLRSRVYDLA